MFEGREWAEGSEILTLNNPTERALPILPLPPYVFPPLSSVAFHTPVIHGQHSREPIRKEMPHWTEM